MLVIAITGGIGSGKSRVSQAIHASLGLNWTLQNADELARRVVLPGSTALKLIKEHFGKSIINQDGSLNRAALGKIVFDDPKARQYLEKILHPLIEAALQEEIQKAKKAEHVGFLYEIPLLFEKNAAARFDAVIVVNAPFSLRQERVKKRSGLSDTEFLQRDASQLPLAEKCAQADFVFDNSEDSITQSSEIEAAATTEVDEALNAPSHFEQEVTRLCDWLRSKALSPKSPVA